MFSLWFRFCRKYTSSSWREGWFIDVWKFSWISSNHTLISDGRFWFDCWKTSFMSCLPALMWSVFCYGWFLWLLYCCEFTILIKKLSFCFSLFDDDVFYIIVLSKDWHCLLHVLKSSVLILDSFFKLDFKDWLLFLFWIWIKTELSIKDFKLRILGF